MCNIIGPVCWLRRQSNFAWPCTMMLLTGKLSILVRTHICTYNKYMKFEFDPDKTAANPLNHEGVTFDEARAVLLGPYALTRRGVAIFE